MARPRKAPSGQAGPAQVVERALNETRPGWLEHETRMKRFNSAYNVYRGTPTAKGSGGEAGSGGTDWRTRLYVKYGMQIIDQAMVNLVQGVPRADVKPRRPGDEVAAQAMEHALAYFTDEDHLAEKETVVAQQALIFGVSPGRTRWLYREEASQQGTFVTDDRPTFEPWDVYNCWWDPLAWSVDSAPYIVLRSYLTRDELEPFRYDDKAGTGRFRNLDLLYASGSTKEPPSRAQNQLYPTPQGAYRDRFEIWEIWRQRSDGLRLTVVGNEQVLLFDDRTPYRFLKGKPITISNSRPDVFRMEGISESDLVDALQQALWTVGNLRFDQWKMTVLRGATVRETIPNMKALVFRPSFLWPVTDHDDVRFQDPPPLPPEAYREDEMLLGRLQYITGISPYVSGASSQGTGVDQNTATGVTLLTQSASRLLQFKAGQIHARTWQRLYEQWADLTQQFLTRELAIRIEGPNREYDWLRVSPSEVIGDFDVRVQAGDEAAQRQQERADDIALLNALAPYAQLGLVNVKPVLRKLARAFNMDEEAVQAILLPETMPQAPASPNGALPLGTPPSPALLGGRLAQQPLASVLRGNR